MHTFLSNRSFGIRTFCNRNFEDTELLDALPPSLSYKAMDTCVHFFQLLWFWKYVNMLALLLIFHLTLSLQLFPLQDLLPVVRGLSFFYLYIHKTGRMIQVWRYKTVFGKGIIPLPLLGPNFSQFMIRLFYGSGTLKKKGFLCKNFGVEILHTFWGEFPAIVYPVYVF